MKRHTGLKILVTGGSRGIGFGVANLLAQQGASVAIMSRDLKTGEEAVARIQAEGGVATFVSADFKDPQSLPDKIAQARDSIGTFDAVCHSAGIYPEQALATMTLESWRTVLDTNLTSAVILARETLSDLKQSTRGRLVLISSITGPRTGISGLTHYGASKGGIDGFMRNAAIELAPYGITVNAVAPGSVLTESLQELYADPNELKEVIERIPACRIGTPDDIAHAVSYMMSEEASFVTGQSLIVDGGQTLPEVQ